MVSAQKVAEYVIWSSHESGSFISNLKLQKLLYYVQAWHLAVFQRPLFPEKFQAWFRGPAIPEIYQRYQGYRWRNIDEEVEPPDLDARTVAFIEEVLEEYGPLDARLLEQLACREDPWIQARGGIADDEPSTATIDEKVMGPYYRQRLSEAEIRDLQEGEERETGAGAEVQEPVGDADSMAASYSHGHEVLSGSGDRGLVKGQPRSGRTAG
jgi:uncharacterized phage-associated protein